MKIKSDVPTKIHTWDIMQAMGYDSSAWTNFQSIDINAYYGEQAMQELPHAQGHTFRCVATFFSKLQPMPALDLAGQLVLQDCCCSKAQHHELHKHTSHLRTAPAGMICLDEVWNTLRNTQETRGDV